MTDQPDAPRPSEEPFVCLNREELLKKANRLPLCPGVYLMRDRTGKIIYVGKSRKLKNRVSQYFQNSGKNIKTEKMVARVANFDYYLCDTEMEALTLENTLIKQHTPRYNIRLKDAKSYPYIKITAEAYPRIVMTRKRNADRGKYFGPYSGVATVYSVIDTLSRVLRLPTCKHSFPRDIGRVRPCIYYQMGRCCGVCCSGASQEEYLHLIDMASDILNGRGGDVRRRVEEQMLLCAAQERFEAAAQLRDTLRALDRLSEKQKVVAAPGVDRDVTALYSDDICACLSVFYIRNGALADKAEFLFDRDQITDAADVISFLCEHYRVRTYVPPEVLLSFPADTQDREMMASYLTGLAGRHVNIRVPERGELRTLCHMVEENARERAMRYRENSRRDEGALLRLAQLCHLETYPERIEAYDISNLGAEHLTAGMIVCRDGQFHRADYRTFRIRGVEGKADDYASMREALARRLSYLTEGKSEESFGAYPDLILLDGGRGHVGVVRELMAQMGLEIPVFGMVKDDFHKTRALCTEHEEISIAREKQVFLLLYRIQEEVHRYTVSRMDAAKRKTLRRSSLENIPGIGPAKASALLRALGTLGAIKAADEATLSAVSGISARDARLVYAYFHPDAAGDAGD